MQRTLKFLATAMFLLLSGHATANFDNTVQTLPAGYAGDDIKKWYGDISTSIPVAANIKDEVFAFAVDLDAGPEFFPGIRYDQRQAGTALQHGLQPDLRGLELG